MARVKLPVFRLHLAAVIIVSMIYWVFNELFQINSYIETPQFKDFENFCKVIKYIHHEGKWWMYVAAFVTDFIWAPLVLTLFHRIIMEKFDELRQPLFYIIAASLAYLLDCWENLSYLSVFPDAPLQRVQKAKLIAYGITSILFVFYWFRYLFERKHESTSAFFVDFGRFLRTSYISLIIILLIVILLTLMGQGSTIIVDLLDRPVNLAGVMIILFFMAVVLSHYPAYLEAKRSTEITWCITKLILPLKWSLGIGVVYYKANDAFFNNRIKTFRHAIGLAMLSSFLYVLLFVGNRFFPWFRIEGSFAVAVFILSLLFYRFVKKKKLAAAYYSIFKYLTPVVLVLCAVLSATEGWSWKTLVASIIAVLTLMVLYIAFRLNRKNSFFVDNVKFIRWIAITGIISLIPLLLANFIPSFAVRHLSPLTILLLYIVNIYGIVVIIFKHILFYRNPVVCDDSQRIRDRFKTYTYLFPTLIVALITWFFVVPGMQSDLHQLQGFKEGETMTVNEFESKIPPRTSAGDSIETYFHVASYGGGLKANLWTLLILNKLQEQTKSNFTNATLTMSGTSGGTMGIGNYAALWADERLNAPDTTSIPGRLWPRIREIGRFNHLSIDMTYLLGKDLIREFLPFLRYNGTDRSNEAMLHYVRMTGLDRVLAPSDTAFRSSWYRIFEASGYFPAIIVNSYATSGAQGNAFTLEVSNFNEAFPGAINMIDQPECNGSITYFGALSASNRFPIFSPTANIKGKGHFLDGGYFDNSGLSSGIAFSRSAFPDRKVRNKEIKYVVIDNHKSNYIKYLIRNHTECCMDEAAVGELSAILEGVAGLDKVPNYFEGLLDQSEGFEPVRIFMPLPITYEDILETFDGKLEISVDTILNLLDQEKTKIEVALQQYRCYEQQEWGIVEPPLARLNSDPGVRYQEAMVHFHPHVRDQLNTIRQLIGVDQEAQQKSYSCD